MPRFRKQVLAPRRYWVAKRDPDGRPLRDTDGQGRTWKKAICHVALTPNPVFAGQRPFGDDGAVLMSLHEPPMLEREWDVPVCFSVAVADWDVALSSWDESKVNRDDIGRFS